MVNKLKILHLLPLHKVPPIGHGGTERIVWHLVREQVRNGHDVTILASPGSSISGARIVTYYGKKRGTSNPFTEWFFNKLEISKQVMKSYLHADKSEFDIVHGHYSESCTSLSFMKRTGNITTHHGTTMTRIVPYTILHLSALTTRGKVVTISKSEYSIMKNVWKDNLVGYVHHGFPLDVFKFVEKPHKEHEIELGFLARIAPFKGTHLAIGIADKLKSMGYDTRLRIIGGVYDRYAEYGRRIATMANDRDYVHFIPNAPDNVVDLLLSSVDVMLYPYLWPEPFSMGIVESGARGTPSIAFNIGSASEILAHEKTGFLCSDVDSAADMVTKIQEIQRTDVRKHMETYFSSNTMYKKYLGIYEKILEG